MNTSQIAVEKATSLFWKYGYSGTGMREIQNALNMRPGSIYNRFQSKEGLFIEVLTHYTLNMEKQLSEVANAESPFTAFETFLLNTLIQQKEVTYRCQCLLIRSSPDKDLLSQQGQLVFANCMATLRSHFVAIIQAMQHAGNISAHVNSEFTGAWLQCQFLGLRTLAASGESKEILSGLVHQVSKDISALR